MEIDKSDLKKMKIIKDFTELELLTIKGNLISVCSSCNSTYTKKRTDNLNICGRCKR